MRLMNEGKAVVVTETIRSDSNNSLIIRFYDSNVELGPRCKVTSAGDRLCFESISVKKKGNYAVQNLTSCDTVEVVSYGESFKKFIGAYDKVYVDRITGEYYIKLNEKTPVNYASTKGQSFKKGTYTRKSAKTVVEPEPQLDMSQSSTEVAPEHNHTELSQSQKDVALEMILSAVESQEFGKAAAFTQMYKKLFS